MNLKLKPLLYLGLISTLLINCKSRKSTFQHKKPVVYIYNNTQDTISLKLKVAGELTSVYPNLSENNEWKVIANSEGKLFNVKDQREYAYLYYEGELSTSLPSMKDGFVIKRSEIIPFLEEKLDEMGMNYQESNDMISYWLPELTEKEYVFISFLFNDECNRYSNLKITPKPDSEFRLMMDFLPLDKKIKVTPQKIESFKRKPYTVVEWGGINRNRQKNNI